VALHLHHLLGMKAIFLLFTILVSTTYAIRDHEKQEKLTDQLKEGKPRPVVVEDSWATELLERYKSRNSYLHERLTKLLNNIDGVSTPKSKILPDLTLQFAIATEQWRAARVADLLNGLSQHWDKTSDEQKKNSVQMFAHELLELDKTETIMLYAEELDKLNKEEDASDTSVSFKKKKAARDVMKKINADIKKNWAVYEPKIVQTAFPEGVTDLFKTYQDIVPHLFGKREDLTLPDAPKGKITSTRLQFAPEFFERMTDLKMKRNKRPQHMDGKDRDSLYEELRKAVIGAHQQNPRLWGKLKDALDKFHGGVTEIDE